MIRRLLLSIVMVFTLVQPAFAVSGLLPHVNQQELDQNGLTCEEIIVTLAMDVSEADLKIEMKDAEKRDLILGCGIQTGRIKFWMVPYLIQYLVDFLLSIAALISIVMIMLGGYYYISGSLSDDKEKGKNTIQYAIIGLVVSLLAWTAVDLVLLLLTS